MAATPSIRIVKNLGRRGQSIKWSNRYHFDGGSPASQAAWETLRANIVAAEKLINQPGLQIIEAYGYDAGSDVPVFTWTGSVDGTATFANSRLAPSDCAALVRYSTTQRTSKNHPVYLFNYYHGVFEDTAGAADAVNPAQLTALNTYAAAWIAGFSDGSVTHHRAGPNGAVAQAKTVNVYIHHRDFPG